jgi:hypothetical protein
MLYSPDGSWSTHYLSKFFHHCQLWSQKGGEENMYLGGLWYTSDSMNDTYALNSLPSYFKLVHTFSLFIYPCH